MLAEDTRRTRVLLRHLGIRPSVVSVREHNEAARTVDVLDWLRAGERLALVSDAGTPLVSDPGLRVARAAAEAGHEVIPVPGPSAVLTALVVSGLPADRFVFLGFPPRKGRARRELIRRIGTSQETVVLFESPERLGALVAELIEACGPERRTAVAREMTKVHEQVWRGTLSGALSYYEEQPPRGEVTVVVGQAEIGPALDAAGRAAAEGLARALLDEGLRPSYAARELARRHGLPRNLAYEIVQEIGS